MTLAVVPEGPAAAQPCPKVCFSFAAYAKNVISHLKSCQIPVAEGLSDEEFSKIERSLNFTFPPDLRSILSEGLPVGIGFPDWRLSTFRQLRMMFDLPMSGIVYGVAKGWFWHDAWGPRPDGAEEAIARAKERLREAPVLVPIYSHCYIPSSPVISGNPVFLIHDAHFYYAGFDVADFFQREAFVPLGFRPCDALVPARCSLGDDQAVPETPVRSGGNTPRKAASQARMISRYKYFNGDRKHPLPSNALNRFTMQAPAWVAKAARRIDFWSDLVEGNGWSNRNGDAAAVASREARDAKEREEEEVEVEMAVEEEVGLNAGWVEAYLVEMEGRLRRGGWKEDDIREMVGDNGEAREPAWPSSPDRESLASHVRLLSTALCKAGWSEQDVIEALGLFEEDDRVEIVPVENGGQ
ncbi:uncharacterized protein LOC116252302 [Nymphaea colorata]|nr:uncharacterized protein LOC116252302 [Nymphaea colorata]